jgi:hypothetical protein
MPKADTLEVARLLREWVRNEITPMRSQLRAQEREIRMLRRAGVPGRQRSFCCRACGPRSTSAASARRGANPAPHFPGDLSERESGGTITCRSQLSCINIPKEGG